MSDIQSDVTDFHRKFGLLVGYGPAIPDKKTVALRDELIREETQEVRDGIQLDDLVLIADGIVDSMYVLIGTAVSYGIDLAPIWEAVHQANMAKEGGGERADGKILKPSGWKAPGVRALLQRQIDYKTRDLSKPAPSLYGESCHD